MMDDMPVAPLNHGVPPRIEGFREVAFAELGEVTPWVPGICFHPQCSKPFLATRPWQNYCCRACKEAAKAEQRAWGYRMALPLLVHRMFKYSKVAEEQALVRVARRHVGQIQTAWLEDRRARIAAARPFCGGD